MPIRKDIRGLAENSWNRISGDVIKKKFNLIGLLDGSSMPSSIAHPDHQYTNGNIARNDDESYV